MEHLQPPSTGGSQGTSSWANLASGATASAAGFGAAAGGDRRRPMTAAMATPHSRLEALLRVGAFAVTGEMQPLERRRSRRGRRLAAACAAGVDAANCTDNPGARDRTCPRSPPPRSSRRAAVAPIVQLTCRDRNRLALPGGPARRRRLGARNVLLLTGDHVSAATIRRRSRSTTSTRSISAHRAPLPRRGRYLSGAR
jgi:hypothetical protein